MKKLLIIIFYSLFFVNTSSFSFHKENHKKDGELIFQDPDITKDLIRQKYCAWKVVKKGSTEQEENDQGQLGWLIYGYHKLKPLPAGEKLILSRELKSQLNFKIDPKTTSLEKILKIHDQTL